MDDRKSIVIFGAGKIGRSFIGQLFGLSGYQVVFIDIDKNLVNDLNHRKSYPVVIRGETEEVIIVSNVRAVSALDQNRVAEEVLKASLLAISVGKNALPKVVPLIAKGIIMRFQKNQNLPLDIILAENMRDAAKFLFDQLSPILPADYPMSRLLGLVETSIGKMVPIIPESEASKDPLKVFAEQYNELILDGRAFKCGVPDVRGLAPKANIQAWVDRKAFIHNLGHATAAYAGFYHHPEAECIWEVLEQKQIYSFTRDVMMQAACILRSRYPEDFTIKNLEQHIDDLLYRFQNRALGDTLFRVGRDLPRKFGHDDRFVGIIRMAIQMGMPYEKILEAMVYGLFFKGKDEKGLMYLPDVSFTKALSLDMVGTLTRVCGFHPVKDEVLITKCKHIYAGFMPDADLINRIGNEPASVIDDQGDNK